MLEKIQQEPKSEDELIELKKYIADHDKNLKQLEAEVQLVYEFLCILEDYCVMFENVNDFWLLKTLPSKIKEEVMDGQRTA